jgi:DeoR family transcriptional regulator, galactitol utilization operon repressor
VSISLSEREKALLELLSEDSNLSVSEVSKLLKVSAVTARNDLDSLAEKGFIIRTRGGAFPAFHPSIMERQKNMIEAKNRISKRAASIIEDGDKIMIEAGTTTAFVAKFLLGKRDIDIVTNSALILPYARSNPSIHLTMVGGEFRASTESFVGSITLRELEQFHVRYAFVGTDGFSIETGLTTHLAEGAEIVRKMSMQAEKTVVVADSSKYGKSGFARVLPLGDADVFISDSGMQPEVRSRLEEEGIHLILV